MNATPKKMNQQKTRAQCDREMDEWIAARRAEAKHRREVLDRAAAAGIIAKPEGGWSQTAMVKMNVEQLELLLKYFVKE